jgi:hypothetical protein
MWEKKGNIFNKHRSQVPVVDEYSKFYRIYSSKRIDGKSVPFFFDVDKDNPSIVLTESETQILDLGNLGSFDWAGIMPTEIINLGEKKYLYYIGWSLRKDVPYHNSLGLAISEDNGYTWKKFSDGPVMTSSHLEPGYIGTVSILIENGVWRMWYLSCRNWIESDFGLEPTYDIKYAESLDGINWIPQNITCISLDRNEGGISSQRVLKINGQYYMWYSIRNKVDFRKNLEDSYRIKKSISSDGVNWCKIDSIELDVSQDNIWDNFMVCYPYILQNKNKLIMFYNGNDFGNTGIGYAINTTS